MDTKRGVITMRFSAMMIQDAIQHQQDRLNVRRSQQHADEEHRTLAPYRCSTNQLSVQATNTSATATLTAEGAT